MFAGNVSKFSTRDEEEKYRQSVNQACAQQVCAQQGYSPDACDAQTSTCAESTQERIVRCYREEAERASRVALRSQQAATFLANNPAFAEFLALKNEGVL